MSNLKPQTMQKIEKALNEMSYRDAIENSSKYNNQLVVDRKTRLPFIDSQTGVAQKDCYLWMQKWQRMPGTNYGQLYTYPATTWKKRRRGYLLNQPYMCRDRSNESDKRAYESYNNGSETSQARPENSENSSDKFVDNSKDAWIYGDYEDSIDMVEGDFEEPNSDADDYDEFTIKRRRRRKESTRRKKVTVEQQDSDKPYACDLCDARYKTRPGLTYHYAHSHQNSNADGEKPSKSSTPVSNVDEDENNERSTPRNNNLSVTSNNSNQGSASGSVSNDTQEPSSSTGKGRNPAAPSPYCDFCLGDSEENKKSLSREKMVSCSDCGRSAHPTCLQFTPQMILSVQKYRWQCIECKSCGLCGTSDNDEQLLFCDDCDRGYHMFCLNPPLSEPPEGSWSCHLCIEEYHKSKNKDELPEEDNKKVEKEGKITIGTNEAVDRKSEKQEKSREKDKPDGSEKVKNEIKKEQDGSNLLVKALNSVNEPAKVKNETIKETKREPEKVSEKVSEKEPEKKSQPVESKDLEGKDDKKEKLDSGKKSEKCNNNPANPPKSS